MTIAWKIRKILSTKIRMHSCLASQLRVNKASLRQKKKIERNKRNHLVILKVYDVFKTGNF